MKTRKAALAGFVFGLALSAGYLASGATAFPELASIILFPGVVVWWLGILLPGHASLVTYTFFILGCIVVGAMYAGIFAAGSLVINRLRYRSRMR